MIPERNTLSSIPYDCRSSVGKATFGWKKDHYMRTQVAARCTIELEDLGMGGGKRIVGTHDDSGDAAYLPWESDRICSVRLSAPSPTGGVRFFFTSTMHGCMFFVDAVPGSKDVICYHANAKRLQGAGGGAPNSQPVECVRQLRALHRAAQRDYGIRDLRSVIEFGKEDYFDAANRLVAVKQARVDERKRQALGQWARDIRHRDVHWGGRCFVCGFPLSGEWRFFYQTWGEVTYVRPKGMGNIFKGIVTGHWSYVRKLTSRGSEEVLHGMGVVASGSLPLS